MINIVNTPSGVVFTSTSHKGHLWAILYITYQLFAAFYRLSCRIANFRDIDLKFLGLISDVNIATSRKGGMPRSYIPKNRFFGILICNLQTRQVMPISFFHA